VLDVIGQTISFRIITSIRCFGSYVTNKEELNDADVVLMMNDDLHPAKAAVEARGLFDHTVAQARYEARLQR
jgi:hypothetical protein